MSDLGKLARPRFGEHAYDTAGLGLLHLAFGLSIDLIGSEITTRGQVAGYWKPLVARLIYGLTFATILENVLAPMMMVIPERLRQWHAKRKGA